METLLMYLIITGALSAVTEGAGLLPDGPLQKQVGDSVLFSTSKTPTEKPFNSVSWTFNTMKIIGTVPGLNNTAPQYEGRITYFPSTASLELRNLLTNDSGLYEVLTLSDTAVTERGSIIMNVYEAVSGVTVSPDSVDLVENASVSLRCFSLGSSLTFLWMNGSTEVTASDRVHLTDGNRNLTFTSVNRYDHGLYTCLVSNPANHSSKTVTITVNYGPEDTHVVVSPDEQYHEIGSTIILKCLTNSRPSPDFTWLVNSTPMLQDGEELKLMDVTTSQNGNYSCRAFNPNTSMTVESPPVSISVIEPSPACSAGCIAGMVIAFLLSASGVVTGIYYCFADRKKTKDKTSDFPNTEVHQTDYVNMRNPPNYNVPSAYYVNVYSSHYENMPAGGRKTQ